MKLLTIAEHFPSPYKPYHHTQFEQFVSDGHDLSIYAFGQHEGSWNADTDPMKLVEGVKYLPSTIRDIRQGLAQLFLNPSQMALKAALRAMRCNGSIKHRILNGVRAILLPKTAPDVVIVHNLRAAVNAQFLKAVYPKAVVAMYYHGGELPGVPVPSDREIRRTFSSFDVVFTNTQSSMQHVIARGQAPDRTVICPVGFNIDDFPDPVDRAYRRDNRLNVLMVGRLGVEKGFICGLQAFRELVRENPETAVMRVVGDGPQRSALKEYVSQHGLDRNVEFLGRLDSQSLRSQYRQADVFLLPSIPLGTWKENQACVVQEAMLMRGIAAVSRTGGVPESTAPQMHPYSFEAGDVAGVIDSLRRLSRLSAAECALLGARGREFVEARYDIRILNRQLLDTALAYRRDAASPSAS